MPADKDLGDQVESDSGEGSIDTAASEKRGKRNEGQVLEEKKKNQETLLMKPWITWEVTKKYYLEVIKAGSKLLSTQRKRHLA